jgi:hypothetical protein
MPLNNEKIDIVIPWVNGNDLIWQKEKDKHDNSEIKTYDNSNMRYRDWGTLKYVLRSIEKNISWYSKIYIITEGHYPDWLNIEDQRIVLITHEELYFNKDHLPTFSSPSIEMNLANIENLEDKFIYLNDDTLILKKLNKNRFFVEGKPVDFISHGWLARNKLFKKFRGMNSWAHSIKNNIDLINSKFTQNDLTSHQLFHDSYSLKIKISNFLLLNVYKKFLWLEHWHHPQPFLKDTLYSTYSDFSEEMMICSNNKFRDNSDLNQYLYRYYQLANGNFYPHKHDDGLYMKIENKEDMNKFMKQITNYAFACPNDSVPDSVSIEEQRDIEDMLISKLEEIFSKKATFEK